MANALVEFYRTQFPDDPRSDDEITLQYAQDHGVEALSSYPGFAADYKRIELAVRRGTAPSLPGELKKSIASGIDQTQAKLYDTAALVGDIVGSGALTKFGQEGYERNLREAAANAPTIQDPREIEGVKDAARYVTGLVGSQAPQMGLTLAGGVAGGLVGGPAGAIAGAGAAGFSQMQNRGELLATPGVEKSSIVPTALGVGAIGAALEELPVIRALKKIFPSVFGQAAEEVAATYLPRLLKEVPTQALLEGGTEVAQELTAMAGELYANRDNPNFQITPKAIETRLLENGLAGALLGGGVGAIEAIPFHARTRPQPSPPTVDALAPSTVTPAQAPISSPGAPVAPAPANPVAPNLGAGAPPPPPPEEVSIPRPAIATAMDVPDDDDLALAAALERGRASTAQRVAEAAAQTDTNPTEAQKEAENYKTGKVNVQGLDISIENPIGSVRSGTGPEGPWEVTMPANYGRILGTTASDGDHVDVYLGPEPDRTNVYVVDQINPETEKFDEVKTMIGFPDKASAIATYDAAFSDGRGPERRAAVTETTIDQFKTWLEKGSQKKPFSESTQTGTKEGEQANGQENQTQKEQQKEVAALADEGLAQKASSASPSPVPVFDPREFVNLVDIAESDLPKHGLPFDAQLPRKLDDLKSVLLMGARDDQGLKQGNAAKTKRVTFFRDSGTGKVWMLGTFQNTKGDVRIVNPEPGLKFEEKQKNGRSRMVTRDTLSLEQMVLGGRFIPIASARFKGAQQGLRFDFTPEQFQEMSQAMALETRRRAAEIETAKAVADAKLMQHTGEEVVQQFNQAPDALTSDEISGGQQPGDEVSTEEAGVVQPEEIEEEPETRAVRFHPEFLYDLHDELDSISDGGELTPDMVFEVLKLMGTDDVGVKQLRENIGKHRAEWVKDQFIPGVTKAFNDTRNISDEAKRQDTFRRAIDRAGQGVLRESLEPGSLHSLPSTAPGRPGGSEVASRFNQVIEAGRDAGITVDIVKAVGKEIGSYNGKERKVTLALFDADHPSIENLRLVLHEFAHDVSRGLSGDLREAVHAAVQSYSDATLGITGTSDPRISQSNPAGLTQPVLNEERLAEHLAQRGLDRPSANSIAAQIVRLVKDFYLRMAMGLQKVMGRVPSHGLALAYVRNRFDAMTAGERVGLTRFLIPPIASEAYPETVFSLPGGLNRIGERLDPKVIVETRVAALNERVDLEKQIAAELLKVPAAVTAAAEDGVPLIDWWRGVTRAGNPAVLIEAERQRIDPTTNLVIGPDPNVRIKDFQAEQNRQLAARDALSDINSQYASVQRRIADLAEESRTWEERRQRATDQHEAIANAPRLPMPPEQEARIKAQMERLDRNAKSYAKKRDQADAMLAAAQQVVGLYRLKVNELKGPLQAHEPFHFGHGATLWVPDRPDATGPGDGFSLLKIQMDAGGQLTKRSEIEAAAEKMGEWLDVPGRAKDGVYYQVKAMQEEILKNRVSTDLRNTDATVSGLATGSLSEQAKGIGTPLWRQIGQMINRFTEQVKFLRSPLEQMALKVNRAKHEAANILGVNQEWYRINFFRPTLNFLESRRDIVEAHPNSFGQQMSVAFDLLRRKYMADPTLAPILSGKDARFIPALRKHVEAEWDVAKFLQQHSLKENIFVRDERIKADRAHIQVGIVTLPRTTSKMFDSVFLALKNANWASASHVFENAAQVYDQLGADQLRSDLAPLFVDPKGEIHQNFFRALVEDTGTFSPFPAPALEDGTQPEANPAFTRDAFRRSGGDPVAFFEAMYDLHGGTTSKADYIQQGLMTFARYFGEMRRLREQIDPDGMAMPKDFRTMIPGLMINAREIEHWPAGWHEYMSFDTPTINRVTERVAAQVAFGNQNERLAAAYSSAVEEYNRDVGKLKRTEEWVAQNVPSTDVKDREAALARELGGVPELKRLRKLRELGGLVDGGNSIRNQLVTYFSGKNSSLKPLRFLQNVTQLFSGLMINQPGSALSQLAETFTPFIPFGPSAQAIRMSLRNITGTAKELAGGLIQALGVSLKRSDGWYQRAMDLGVKDYDAVKRIKDILQEPGHFDESASTKGVRKLRSILNTAAGAGTFTGFRPLAPFAQVNTALHMVSTVNFWKEVDDMVARGVKWVRNNPTLFGPKTADDKLVTWADRLGYSGTNRDGFTRIMQRALDDWGLDYFGLVNEGLRNEKAGKPLLSDETLSRLQGMWVKESSTEANIATMSSAAFNNSVLRFMLPLLGWGWRRGRQVAGLRLDEQDKASYAALSKGLLGLAMLGAGGLGVSALVDLYNEELQRKRRNLRRLTLDQDGANFAMALLEHSARVGTFGILGDLANEAVNVGTGSGANRGISADNRVVFLNSVMGMVRATSAFINQDFEADYMNVIRPMLFSMGGNGALQYLQMANTVFDFDNVESRAVRRTNVGNWLRVVGREQGLEVNTDQRGYSSPTPITPFITRMQLAALADDHLGFMEARSEAMAKAREEGKLNAAEYVARTYASRNPLKTVFRTPPTELQYRQLLNALPDDGREDVMQAVNLFNRYGATMGVMPFDGKEARPARGRAVNLFSDADLVSNARSRAALY